MIESLKYLTLGLLGLSLKLALPQVPIDWAALVLTQAYLSGVRRFSSWAVLFALAFAYSAFSLHSPFAFAWPWALAWLLCIGLRQSFEWEGLEERAVLLALLCLLPTLGTGLFILASRGVWLLDGKDWLAALVTFSLGYFGAPLFSRLVALLPRSRRIDLTRADWLSAKGERLSRKPFGLEKGL